MKKQDLINNLKSLKSSIRDSRELVRTSAGVLTRRYFGADKLLPLGEWIPAKRRSYVSGSDSCGKVEIVTPDNGHYMHTFYDVDPLSPSGRYLAVTRVPFIWRVPYPGDTAQACIIDLHEQKMMAVYNTCGWGTQLGANVQWGATDDTLYCNNVVNGVASGIEINLASLKARILEGPIYGLNPECTHSYAPNIELVNASQTGYGVPEPFFGKPRLAKDGEMNEGIWRTDLRTGTKDLFIRTRAIISAIPHQEELSDGTYYIYNVKVNASGTKLLVVLFTKGATGRMGWPMQLVTCNLDGSGIELPVPDSLWRLGGHHANWHPDSHHIVMNLRPDRKNMGFYTFGYDGSDLTRVAVDRKGGGHPSIERTGRYLMTDAYVSEGLANKKGEVPVRLIDLRTGVESAIEYIYTNNVTGGRRVDPHPVWTHRHGTVCFNGISDGKRQVFLGHLQLEGL